MSNKVSSNLCKNYLQQQSFYLSSLVKGLFKHKTNVLREQTKTATITTNQWRVNGQQG